MKAPEMGNQSANNQYLRCPPCHSRPGFLCPSRAVFSYTAGFDGLPTYGMVWFPPQACVFHVSLQVPAVVPGWPPQAVSHPCRGDGIKQRSGNTWWEWNALGYVTPAPASMSPLSLFSSTSPLDVNQNCEASGLEGGGLGGCKLDRSSQCGRWPFCLLP